MGFTLVPELGSTMPRGVACIAEQRRCANNLYWAKELAMGSLGDVFDIAALASFKSFSNDLDILVDSRDGFDSYRC